MENEELTTFSLEDNPNEEVIEEEVIDRDEEYDDGYEDDDEEEEEYDDYDDEYDEEEDYDDGYNDDYYDDRLDKVLDEIAELKRGMSAPSTAVQQQPMFPPVPQYIYQQPAVGGSSAGSDVLMYNEISRLRDELTKNQNSLEMQKELTRIKDDMARDQRFAESQYNAEIKRLQDRIEDLLKNAESSQGELPPPAHAQAAQLESGKINSERALDFDKLLSINESILRSTRDSDSRIQNEISHLRGKVEAMPTAEELSRAVSALKKAAGNGESANAETLSKLSNEIAALRAAISDVKSSVAAPAAAPATAMPVVVEGGAVGSDIDAGELLRQLYEIRNTLGSSSTATVNRTRALLDLVADYRKVSFDVRAQSASLKDKLSSVYGYVKKLKECNEPDAVDLIEATNEIIRGIAAQKLDKQSFADLASYLAVSGTAVPAQVRESADKFFEICNSVAALETLDTVGDYLPDLLAERNTIESNRHEEQNSKLVNEITSAMLDENRDDEAIADKVAKLCNIAVSDVAELPLVDMPKNYKPSHAVGGETIFSKLAELKAAFDDSMAVRAAAENAHTDAQSEEEYDADDNGSITLQDVFDAVDELRVALAQMTGSDENADISSMLEEIRNNYIELSGRIVEISDLIVAQGDGNIDDDADGEMSDVLSDEQKLKAVDDLEYIRARVAEQEALIGQIADVRNDIINISGSIDLTEQLASVTADIATQFDKLYEDLSNVLIESEANIIGKITDPAAVIDAVEAAKLDVLADTQAIRDSVSAAADGKAEILASTQEIKDTLALISESITSTAVLDAIDGIRADLSAFADMTAVNTDASTADRQKLLEDVAFLREQAEAAMQNAQTEAVVSEETSAESAAVAQDSDKVYAYLDELANRVAMLGTVPDDIAVAKETINVVAEDVVATKDALTAVTDNVLAAKDALAAVAEDTATAKESVILVSDSIAALGDNVTAINDNVTAVNDNVAAIGDSVAAFGNNVAAINDNIVVVADTVKPLAEDVAAARDAAISTLDALAPISDQLNAILDRLDSGDTVTEVKGDNVIVDSSDEPALVLEDLAEIKDSLNTVLDTLPLLPQSDDLITARDNTYSILDTLTMMPQSDDIVATRDNVAAVLDGVNAITESIKAMTESIQNNAALVDDMAVIIDNTSAILDSMASLAQTQEDVTAIREAIDAGYTATSLESDIQYIRQKLDEQPADGESADIAQDLGLVLDKLEAFEQTAIADKQDLLNAISGIREEVHISELDGNIAASGSMDDETRDILVNEISEIRERLSNIENSANAMGDVSSAALDNINIQLVDIQNALVAAQEQSDTAEPAAETVDSDALNAIFAELADIKSRIEGGVTVTGTEGGDAATSESLQAIADELAIIREKIDAESEYDTVEEILSLRDDVKAARIVDQNEVSGELESIKNELAAISSGNILDEIRALRDDIASVSVGGEDAPAPTNDELNLVLNEIVSLRDEMFAFKDEVLSATAAQETEEPVAASDTTDDDVTIILDELTALRADQTVITDSIDELKDIISRRTSIVADADEQESVPAAASNELNVVLGEIIDIKNNIERVEENLTTDRLDALTEQVEQIRSLIDELRISSVDVDADGVTAELSESAQPDYAIADDIAELRAEISLLRSENEELRRENADMVTNGLNELRDAIRDLALVSAVPTTDAAGDTSYAALIDEIRSLKADLAESKAESRSATLDEETIQSLKDALAAQSDTAMPITDELSEIRDEIAQLRSLTTLSAENSGAAEIAEIKDELEQLRAALSSSDSFGNITEDINSIRADIQSIKEEPDLGVLNEILALRDEIAQLRSLATPSDESAGAAEIAEIKDELEQLRAALSSSDSFGNIAEDVTSIKADVQSIKEEPDLGVLNEILALRDEFQKLREEIEDVKNIASKTDEQSDEAILNEVQSLRDQLFAISMANVNDSASGESNYESYNNLILDELASLREQAATAGSEDELKAVTAEIQDIKAALESREELYDALAKRVAEIDSDAINNKILEELSSLRTELANQRDADLTTLNFMSEMAHLLERQNNYISQNAGTMISDEIESLKAEIASTDSVAEEIAKLRDIMTSSGNAADNDTILNELAGLREELSEEKPSKENELILEEIARLRDELITLKDREQIQDSADSDLRGTLSDLKDQLNEIAEIVEPVEKPATAAKPASTAKKPAAKKSSSTAKRGRPAGKSTGAKSGKKSTAKKPAAKRSASANKAAVQTSSVTEQPVGAFDERQFVERDEIDFDAKFGDELAKLTSDNSDLSLNPQGPISSDSMDVADKLAKQVANKLVMEQLVEQLGDGGVSDERVDEILRDILPQEFTTVALNEQSDKVRKLANRLVLNKLRDRLRGRLVDEEDDDDSNN